MLIISSHFNSYFQLISSARVDLPCKLDANNFFTFSFLFSFTCSSRGGLSHIDILLMVQLDDALSAMRLEDGRIRVWIHVADPTCLVKPHSIIERLFIFQFW